VSGDDRFGVREPPLIEGVNHVGIVVADLEEARAHYRDRLGATCSERVDLPDEGVSVIFVDLGNAKIELLQPLGPDSPIRRFLERRPSGGMHHVCLTVADLARATQRVVENGGRILGGGIPRVGARGRPVVFLDPKGFSGTLLELEEAPPRADSVGPTISVPEADPGESSG